MASIFRSPAARSARNIVTATSRLSASSITPSSSRLFVHPICRSFSSTSPTFRSDDPGGKPNDGSHATVYDDFYNMLESADGESNLSVASISANSTTLSDGLVLTSPMMLINNTCFMWDPPALDPGRALPNGAGWEEWDSNKEDIWKLLDIVEPKPEVLVLGTGRTVLYPPASVRSHLNMMGIQVDVQSSYNAASTYNVLSEEGRKVAIAVIPSERLPLERRLPGQEEEVSVPGIAQASPQPAPSSAHGIDPNATRSFSTSARQRLAQPAPSLSDLGHGDGTGKHGGSNGRRSRLGAASKSPPLSLQHFVYRSQTLALYRSYLRATRPIPNPDARRETVAYLRHDVFDRFKGEVDLENLRQKLAWAHRELKLHQGGMLLSAHGPVGEAGTFPKLRGARKTIE